MRGSRRLFFGVVMAAVLAGCGGGGSTGNTQETLTVGLIPNQNPQEVVEISRAIGRPTADPIVSATVSLPSGEELAMVYEGGKWRIDAAAVDLYGQATPRQALLGFLRAFERKRYDVVLRFVPDAEKEGLSGVSGEASSRYVVANSAKLQLLTAMRAVAELKSKLQRTNPVEHPTKYNQMFSELVVLEARRKQLQARSLGAED